MCEGGSIAVSGFDRGSKSPRTQIRCDTGTKSDTGQTFLVKTPLFDVRYIRRIKLQFAGENI